MVEFIKSSYSGGSAFGQGNCVEVGVSWQAVTDESA